VLVDDVGLEHVPQLLGGFDRVAHALKSGVDLTVRKGIVLEMVDTLVRYVEGRIQKLGHDQDGRLGALDRGFQFELTDCLGHAGTRERP
jgi:hypothetical protein